MLKAICVYLILLALISGIILAFYYNKDKQKMFAVCFCTILFILLLTIPLTIDMKNSREDKINEMISARGGEVISIHKMQGNDSPFQDEVEQYNAVYEIQYEIDDEVFTAWFRTIDMLVTNMEESLTGKGRFYREAWIFSEDYLNTGSGEAIESNERTEVEPEQLGENSKVIQYINADQDIRIYGEYSEQDGMISDFVISYNNDQVGPFQWKQSLLRDPIVYWEDINQDNQNELVFIIIFDHGTGMILSEAHVVASNMSESVVAPIQDIISEKIKFSGKKVFMESSLIYEASEYGELKPYFDEWINYIVVDGKLLGAVRIGDGRAEQYAGYLEVEYGYQEGEYNVKEIRHITDAEWQSEGTPLQFTVKRNF